LHPVPKVRLEPTPPSGYGDLEIVSKEDDADHSAVIDDWDRLPEANRVGILATVYAEQK